ncbi:hypothetical protein SAMN05444411_1177 [Lutibacter oricola]|uniref:Uncharacterized protein n=1 Tax=Lutibacter oricola TaxID=762486 RepID=A0A1H3GSF6_9FLAO|nr:hypothetical protein [Lutibacter oricola]SDY06201.1 hypothetical protein SAMN05444411_1177 [Lutibacter oricola]
MTTNILENNYIFNHKYFKKLRWIGIFYFYFLLKITAFEPDESITDLKDEIAIISLILIVLLLVLFILNEFLFTRVGEIQISKNNVRLEIDDWIKDIDLTKVEKVELEFIKGIQYDLIIDNTKILIEIENYEYHLIEKLIPNLKVKNKKIVLKNILKRFATKNRESYRDIYNS